MHTQSNMTMDNLFAGDVMPVVTVGIVIVQGQVLTRGTVLGEITASKKCAVVDSSKADGTQKPYAILTDDIDATAGDVKATAYVTGEFNESALVFGGADTVATHKKALREIGIITRPVVNA